jgi:hypothetical protein
MGSRDSLDSIVTGLWAEQVRIRPSILGRERYLFPQNFQTGSGADPVTYSVSNGRKAAMM